MVGRRHAVGRKLRHGGGGDVVLGHAGRLDRAAGEPLPLGEQAEDEVQAGELAVPTVAALVLGLQHHHLGPVGEPVHRRKACHEALLHGLFGDAHALPDQRPRGAGPTGLVDEVPDQVVSQLAEVVGDRGRLGQVVQGGSLRVGGPDLGDELVEGHVVNSRLTIGDPSTPG